MVEVDKKQYECTNRIVNDSGNVELVGVIEVKGSQSDDSNERDQNTCKASACEI